MQSLDLPAAPATGPQTQPPSQATPRPRWRLIHYMTVLFLVFQMAAALTMRPGGHFGDISDTGYYGTWGLLSYRGMYPYLDYWVEYPPVLPWLAVLAFRLTAWLPRGDVWGLSDIWFRLAMSSVSALASTGILVLVYRLARLCWKSEGRALRAAMAYALAYVPLFVTLGYMDTLPLFMLLLSLDLTLRHRARWGGAIAGLGVLTKLYPGVVLLAALRTRGRWRWVVACVAAVTIGLAPFAVLSPRYLLASGQAMLSRHSWETVWALFEGYYSYGTLSGDHFDASAARQGAAHPLAYYACLLAAAAVAVALYWRTRHVAGERRSVALTGFAVTLMLLVYSGYSPQFAVWLVPFVAIMLPNRHGVAYLTGLTVMMLAERMLYFTVLPDSRPLLTGVVVLRTLLYAALALEMLPHVAVGSLWQIHDTTKRRVRVAVAAVAGVALLVGSGWLVRSYLLPRYRVLNRMSPVLAAMESLPRRDGGVVVTSEEAFAYARPYLGDFDLFLATYEDYQPSTRWQRVSASLGEFIDSHEQVWLLLDSGVAFNADLHRDITARTEAAGYVSYERWFEHGVWAGCYAMGEPEQWQEVAGGEFTGGPRLAGAFVEQGPIASGEAVRVRLSWQAQAIPEGDLSLFVHLLDADGTPVAQIDWPLANAAWQSVGDGATAEARLAIYVPEAAAAGTYALAAGVYSSGTGARLPLADGRDWLTLGTVVVAQ